LPYAKNLQSCRAFNFLTIEVSIMQTNAPSLAKITLVYLGFYLGMAILLNAILWAAERFLGFTMEANAIGWLPLILGAMMAGQHYGAKVGGKPRQSYSWMAGLLFMLTSVLLSLGLLYVIALAMGYDVGALMTQAQAEVGGDGALIAGIIGGVLLLIWVLQRFMFSMGAAQGAKQAAMRGK
jgi:hypothetical protein